MSLGDKMFNGLAWSAIEKLAIQIIQFVIGIVLANLLTPDEYGIIGVLLVFIAISKVFIDSGFTQALIQKQNRSEKDISSVFYVNIGISIACYALLFVFAQTIANYYENNELASLLKFLALSLIINAIFTVPATLLTIDLNFKVLTKVTLVATIISGILAIYFAYVGYGVWALVWQAIIRAIIVSVIVWFFIKWRPKLIFSWQSIRQLFKFGSNLLASSLLNTVVNNFYALFIAKLISTQDLGYYTRGTQFADVIFSFVNTSMNRVLLPGLSTIQDNLIKLVSHTRKIIRSVSVIVVPIFFFLTVMAKPIIQLLLPDIWLPAVPIMQFLCIARLITIISGINVNILTVLGKTNLMLRQQYIKIIVRITIFLITVQYGIYYIALGELISTIIHFFINTHYPGKIMNYGALSQIKDMSKILLAGTIMVIPIWVISNYITNNYILITVAVLIAISIYFLMLRWLKITELDFLKNKALAFINPRKIPNGKE
jgi:O-antigen/teichoic acid export membrane protein